MFATHDGFKSYVDLYRHRADQQSDELAYVFLEDGDNQEKKITFGDLHRQALIVAADIREFALEGERVLLVYQPGTDFIITFTACIYAGVIAVPVFPPQSQKDWPRFVKIVRDCNASLVCTANATLKILQAAISTTAKIGNVPCIGTDIIIDKTVSYVTESEWHWPDSTHETIMFLQYTSGSTGDPKGVMVSHGNLLHNEHVNVKGLAHRANIMVVNWCPQYHDLGLIGNILLAPFTGRQVVLMSPIAFLQKPVRWLKAISKYKATASGGPNFAYELCLRKVADEDIATLDLSSWELAYSGAEIIRPATLERFYERFKVCGFRKEAFSPVYGLAESTLIVTATKADQAYIRSYIDADSLHHNKAVEVDETNPSGRWLIGCGQVIDQELKIVNPDNLHCCDNNEVGEIWVKGKSVCKGYWGKPETTKKAFQAYTSDTDEGPFLRTGDLGFVRDGELYVTGRHKEVVIIDGRNLYPQDIEDIAQHERAPFRSGCGAAFSIEVEGKEELVLVQELAKRNTTTDTDFKALVASVRKEILDVFGVPVFDFVLIEQGTFLKTSSGKIRRRGMRDKYLQGKLKIAAQFSQAVMTPGHFESESFEASKHAIKHSFNALGAGFVESKQPKPSVSGVSSPVPLAGPQVQLQLEKLLVSLLSSFIGLPESKIDITRPFSDYGLDSKSLIGLSGELSDIIGRSLQPRVLYDYPSIELLVSFLAPSNSTIQSDESLGDSESEPSLSREPIAIVGMSCRYPGNVNTPEQFWELLTADEDGLEEVPPSRWNIDDYYDPDPAIPGKMQSRRGGFVSRVGEFDAAFFNISPREAIAMDPQQRFLLETCWEALENAAIKPSSLSGTATGVYIGISNNDYDRLRRTGQGSVDAYNATGNAFSIAANRLSYVLNLNGPSQAIDTACSSSLVAIHQACQSLHTGETSLGLVGGVNLILSPDLTLTFSKARMMAPDGRCKTFDNSADGYVRGEGCGFFVLKRLSDAEANGDPILAVIKGSGVSQDGRSNGLTAPHGPSQELAIKRALKHANLQPKDIQYVEAHGTGTPLGDPIEIEALNNVYSVSRDANSPLLVGSVKTNIGHLEAAAGVAGLSKVILALQNQKIPAHLNCRVKNKLISWDKLNLEIPTSSQDWLSNGEQKRRAGISSFGFGGTNAHLIVEEYVASSKDDVAKDKSVSEKNILCLSAKSQQALFASVAKHLDHLQCHENIHWENYCYSVNTGRDNFLHRIAVCTDSVTDFIAKLATVGTEGASPGVFMPSVDGPVARVKTAFLFTGQGAQYEGMGAGLYEKERVFQMAIDECAVLIESDIEISLSALLFDENKGILHLTKYTQVGLFCLEYALAKLWLSWGVKPDYMIGHSVGEYAAACIAGVFSLEDALKLISARGRLMQELDEPGSMLVVFTHSADVVAEIAPYSDRVSVGAINGPGQVALSGGEYELSVIAKNLDKKGIETRTLKVSHGFHSPLMQPMIESFRQVANEVHYSAPKISMISNVTGQIESALLTSADYWCDHILASVLFEKGMRTLGNQLANVFIEIGPQMTLTRMGKRCLETASEKGADCWIASMMPEGNDSLIIQDALARYYVAGGNIHWDKVNQYQKAQRISIPTYAFQRSQYWLEKIVQTQQGASTDLDLLYADDNRLRHPLLGQRLQSPRLRSGEMHFDAFLNNKSPYLIKAFFRDNKASLQLPLFIEMMLESGAEAFHTSSVSVQDIELNREEFGTLGDENLNIQTFVESIATNELRVKCYALGLDSAPTQEWVLLSNATVTLANASVRTDANRLSTFKKQITQELDAREYFESCNDRGLYYCAGAPRRIQRLYKNDTEALSEVKLAQDNEILMEGLRLPHGFVEAGFQTIGALFYTEDEETFMPYRIGQIDVFSELGPIGWLHISIQDRWEEKETHIRVNVEWLNEDGQTAVKISGMRFQAKKAPMLGVLEQLRRKDTYARREQLYAFIVRLVSQGLGLQEKQVDPKRSLIELGMDSLIAMEILGRVRFVLEVEVNVVSLQKGMSVSELTQLVDDRLTLKFGLADSSENEQGISSEEISSLVVIQKGAPGSLPLILVHPLGGSVFCYNDLSRALGSEQALYALQAHAFIDESYALESIEAMASEYVREIRAVQPYGPYLLGGWSLGGVISMEIAHQFREQNEKVDILALIDSAPSVFSQLTTETERDLFVLRLVVLDAGLTEETIKILEKLPLSGALDYLHQQIKRQSRQPNLVSKDDFEHRVNVMRQLLALAIDYQVPKYLGEVSLFKADQPLSEYAGLSSKLGWDQHVEYVEQVQTIPGNHFTLLHGSSVKLLASYLRKRIKAKGKVSNRYFNPKPTEGYTSKPNNVVEEVAFSAGGQVSGLIQVDESHPFFFDHPLDHIPGTLIIESVTQLLAQLVKPIDPDNDKLSAVVKYFSITFRRWIEKQDPTFIELKLTDGTPNCLNFSGMMSQRESLVSDLTVALEYVPKSQFNGLMKRPEILEDQILLHKHNIENVLLQPINKGPGNCYECSIALPSEEHLFSEHQNQGLIPLIVIEAARQLVTLLAHTVYGIPQGMRMNLISLEYKADATMVISPHLIFSHQVDSNQVKEASDITRFEIVINDGTQDCGAVIFTAQAVDELTYQKQRKANKVNKITDMN
jgi:phthiocerol/phenolphthiocerol synthesis type-I polyketide synthase C